MSVDILGHKPNFCQFLNEKKGDDKKFILFSLPILLISLCPSCSFDGHFSTLLSAEKFSPKH